MSLRWQRCTNKWVRCHSSCFLHKCLWFLLLFNAKMYQKIITVSVCACVCVAERVSLSFYLRTLLSPSESSSLPLYKEPKESSHLWHARLGDFEIPTNDLFYWTNAALWQIKAKTSGPDSCGCNKSQRTARKVFVVFPEFAFTPICATEQIFITEEK